MRQQGWLRILAFLAFSWVAFLLVTVKLVRQQDTNDGDSSQRLARALRELDKLHRSNAELNALVLDLNYNPRIDNKKILLSYFQNSKRSGLNGPSEEYELSRRRIFSNTKELWYYVNSELQSLVKEDDSVRVEHISKIKNIIGEHYRSLLKDVSSLSDVDGHAVWRQQESENLSNLVQKRLKHLQNPSDCAKARKLVCDLNKGCGYGCQLHHVVYCFIVAYATERTLILRSKGWRYSKGGWQDVFLPLSDTCLLPNGETTNRWPGHRNTQVITLPIIDSINPRPPFLPLALPEDLAPRLNVLHGDPVVWWIGQFLKYMLRPQPATSNKLDEYAKKVKFQKPIVGVHIRRTDKVGTEAAFHKLDEYMVHVEQYYKYKELTDKVDKKRVYLATDEPKLFSEAKRKYPEYEIVGDEDISKTASISKRYSDQSLSGIITDIHFLSLSDYLVCTFSSQVCRVAYEIMNSLHPDASTLYTSLDDIYYYGGQKRRLHVAVLPHKANGPHEMNLLVGDEIAVAGNHWDGYSKGTNLRTKESGLYPTFKVSPKIETAPFASYPDVTLSTNELQEQKR
ncbi:alpha-(1,6)-fucosyltransferase [Metopolophium dirhodum]|uniref:alpha-(1,6)-fucosyltransferase n=1 Tax=Metopolophium dirhodum TaxID=44670 RepID=UPI00298F81F6|nr:alpha-(1,6)-fucosyltransferase [Metopolophium dirhodum]XP_060867738.1 alpha-(1,6)-fucosyltransferase [Metopolophium dirhodum]XP_060867739.1 alpha-(1,6)-fucosyltransferase [Metopolophium dirhodum]